MEPFIGADRVVRIGHWGNVQYREYTLPYMSRNGTDYQEILEEAEIVFGTLTGCGGNNEMKNLPPGHFDLTVVDECGQALEAAVWAVVRFTSKLLLAGDHLQLPPFVLPTQPDVRAALSLSMMERLVTRFDPPVVSLLETQYRMNYRIMAWSSHTFYEGKLKAAPSVEDRTLAQLPGVRDCKTTRQEIRLVDTGGVMAEQKSTDPRRSSKANPGEAGVILAEVRKLVTMGVKPENIGVITFYALQADILRHNIHYKHPGVEIHTVDGFQGSEKEVILVSPVCSNTEGHLGFLKEHTRLNVAVTRAKRQLVIVADRKTVSGDYAWNSLMCYIEEKGHVCDGSTVQSDTRVPRWLGLEM